MNLKNYSSGIAAATTISYIEQYLMEAGASGIMKKVEGGQVVALMFEIDMGGNTGKHLVKLPASVPQVHEYLWRDYVTSRTHPKLTEDDFLEQAGRTAWKIVQDWVQVQVSMIKLKQMEPMQVFLPYIWDGNQTYYEFLKERKFKALPAPSTRQVE